MIYHSWNKCWSKIHGKFHKDVYIAGTMAMRSFRKRTTKLQLGRSSSNFSKILSFLQIFNFTWVFSRGRTRSLSLFDVSSFLIRNWFPARSYIVCLLKKMHFFYMQRLIQFEFPAILYTIKPHGVDENGSAALSLSNKYVVFSLTVWISR